jgi:iron complex transport system substrate-binding protein
VTKLLIWLSFVLAAPTLEASPQRIASCFVAADEMVIDLLSPTKELHRLIAVSTLAEDPRYSFAAPLPKTVTHRCGAELESLLAARPDLVILASFNRPELIDRLRQAKVAVHVLENFNGLDDVAANLKALGKLLGTNKAAARLAGSVEATRNAMPTPAAPTLLSLSSDGVVAAGDTLFDDVVRASGGVNLAARQGLKGWPRLSAEALAKLDPDYLVASGEPGDPEALERALTLAQGPSGYAAMRAVKEKRIILIPERELSAASHHVLKAVRRLSTALKKGPA